MQPDEGKCRLQPLPFSLLATRSAFLPGVPQRLLPFLPSESCTSAGQLVEPPTDWRLAAQQLPLLASENWTKLYC